MTKELDWIELFAPQEILRDFDFEKLVEEDGIYRIYMVEKEDADHIPAELKKRGQRRSLKHSPRRLYELH
ncbi:hypothetical protein [Porphyromonas vaginalis]|uniref:hypothetical protein n=1 Tax=Porphyromonas vaginalis TaxID=3044325 RepID=UPI00260C57B8|nr:hypothetical protein [Porphyromonas vaginalis]